MKSISCPLCCNSTFANQSDLKAHLLRVTTKLQCSVCFCSFNSIGNLIDHLDQCKGNTFQGPLRPDRKSSRVENYSPYRHDSRQISASRGNNRSAATISSSHENSVQKEYSLRDNNHIDRRNFIVEQGPFEDEDDDFPYSYGENLSPSNNEQKLVADKSYDVDYFFCTMCEQNLPDIEAHIQQFHLGQQVFLEDDSVQVQNVDEEDNELFSAESDTDYNTYSIDEEMNGDISMTKPSVRGSERVTAGIKSTRGRSSAKQRKRMGDGMVPMNERIDDDDDYDDEFVRYYCTICNAEYDSFAEHENEHRGLINFKNLDESMVLGRKNRQQSKLRVSNNNNNNNNNNNTISGRVAYRSASATTTTTTTTTIHNPSSTNGIESRKSSVSLSSRRQYTRRGGRGARGGNVGSRRGRPKLTYNTKNAIANSNHLEDEQEEDDDDDDDDNDNDNDNDADHDDEDEDDFTTTTDKNVKSKSRPSSRFGRSKSLPPSSITNATNGNNRRNRGNYSQQVTTDVVKRERYGCEHCDKIFSDKYMLAEHVARHLTEKSIVCPYCDEAFTTVSDVLTHQKTHFGSGSGFACGQCDKTFKYMSGLNVHLSKSGHFTK